MCIIIIIVLATCKCICTVGTVIILMSHIMVIKNFVF